MTMPFHEVQFPPSISLGAIGGPSFSTTVLALSGGAERRNQNWSGPRHSYDVSHGLKTQADIDELHEFFFGRRGKAFGFRFKDWNDYRLPNWDGTPGDRDALPVFFTTVGLGAGHSTFQLSKVYDAAVNPYVRVIQKPVAGSLVLFADALLTTDWTVDTTTGIVTLGTTLSHTTGQVITGYCEFDVPVRFDTDEMKVTLTDIDNFSWPQIPVIELRSGI